MGSGHCRMHIYASKNHPTKSFSYDSFNVEREQDFYSTIYVFAVSTLLTMIDSVKSELSDDCPTSPEQRRTFVPRLSRQNQDPDRSHFVRQARRPDGRGQNGLLPDRPATGALVEKASTRAAPLLVPVFTVRVLLLRHAMTQPCGGGDHDGRHPAVGSRQSLCFYFNTSLVLLWRYSYTGTRYWKSTSTTLNPQARILLFYFAQYDYQALDKDFRIRVTTFEESVGQSSATKDATFHLSCRVANRWNSCNAAC